MKEQRIAINSNKELVIVSNLGIIEKGKGTVKIEGDFIADSETVKKLLVSYNKDSFVVSSDPLMMDGRYNIYSCRRDVLYANNPDIKILVKDLEEAVISSKKELERERKAYALLTDKGKKIVKRGKIIHWIFSGLCFVYIGLILYKLISW